MQDFLVGVFKHTVFKVGPSSLAQLIGEAGGGGEHWWLSELQCV